MRSRNIRRGWLIFTVMLVAFAFILSRMDWWETFLRRLFPLESQVIHPGGNLLVLTLEHLALVGLSSLLTVLVGVGVGVLVTRPGGEEFLPLASDTVSLAQTFPPVAVVALAFPILGFGFWPTILALFLYGLFPIMRNTVAGLGSISSEILESAAAMGMSPLRSLNWVEFPLALSVVLSGIRTSVVINVGTATIGAAIGGGGLGVPIIGGLAVANPAYVLEGALAAALLALLLDYGLSLLESSAVPRSS